MSFIKSFFAGPDGQGSSKRLKSFIFCLLVCSMIISGKVATNVQLYSFYALLITILLLDAVITVQDITNLRSGNSNPHDVIKEGDTVELTKKE
jgi:hypothetical protein